MISTIRVGDGVDTDGDGKALTYSIIAGNDNGLFALNQSTGVITLATGKSLDYETSPSHTLVVQAAESDGSGTDTAVITINVGNVNEHAPVIDDISVDALESIGDTDVIVDLREKNTFADVDKDNESISYSITAGNPVVDDTTNPVTKLFTIDSATGVIKLTSGQSLDFETTSSYSLTVRATESDGNAFDDATVSINVVNIDDNNPDFTDLTVSVSEDIEPGTVITDLKDSTSNTDNDADGSPLTYALSAGDSNLFEVVSTTGEIKLKQGQSLDYETTNTYTLSITATESDGSPNASSTINVTLNITDANESAIRSSDPTFTFVSSSEDQSVTFSNANLIKGYVDPDGDSLSVSAMTASNGSVEKQNNGDWIFTPEPNFNGTVNLVYTITDGLGGNTEVNSSFTVSCS